MDQETLERIRKYAFKRTNPMYRGKLWKKTPYHEWKYESAYDNGFTDAMRQIVEFAEYLQEGKPED